MFVKLHALGAELGRISARPQLRIFGLAIPHLRTVRRALATSAPVPRFQTRLPGQIGAGCAERRRAVRMVGDRHGMEGRLVATPFEASTTPTPTRDGPRGHRTLGKRRRHETVHSRGDTVADSDSQQCPRLRLLERVLQQTREDREAHLHEGRWLQASVPHAGVLLCLLVSVAAHDPTISIEGIPRFSVGCRSLPRYLLAIGCRKPLAAPDRADDEPRPRQS